MTKHGFLVVFLLVLFLSNRISAQNSTDSNVEVIEKQAEFQNGGLYEFAQFIEHTVKYPETATNEKIDGKVVVEFRIDSLGNLVDIKILRSLRKDFDDEVIKALQQSPKWKPAEINNRPVSQRFTLPQKFFNDPETNTESKKRNR